jgi:protein-L-isoaspartate(D-aspartate) O-methyltransferase
MQVLLLGSFFLWFFSFDIIRGSHIPEKNNTECIENNCIESNLNPTISEKMDFARLRKEMVARTIAARGVSNARVLEAMTAVKREEFVPTHSKPMAYEDSPLPIGSGQTISQPYIVALMVEAMKIKPEDKVLEVGTGCGYAAAVLGHLAREVHSIERIPELAETASERLKRLGYNNIFVHVGDGTKGLPSEAPFNSITVAASGPKIPISLVNQLVEGGRIVIPIENQSGYQDLLVATKHGDKLKLQDLGGVRFVPLIGEEGYIE